MSTKKIPNTISDKFKRKLYKINDFVCIYWLKEKKYGYITKINERSGGVISYMVKTQKYSYPCGIKIKEYKSAFAGVIAVEETKSLGSKFIQQQFTRESNSTTQAKTTSRTRTTRDINTTRTDKKVLSDKPKAKPKRKTTNKRKPGKGSLANGSSKKTTTVKSTKEKQSKFLEKFT